METVDFNYELTKYPTIFKETYWGTFRVGPLEKSDKVMLAENRNKLVETYKLVKRVTNFAKKYLDQAIIENEIGRDKRDHKEYYTTEKNDIVAVFSMHVDEKLKHEIQERGYVLVDPLYMLHQASYVKLIVNEMPRITKKMKEETIIPFAQDAIKIMKEHLNLESKEREWKEFKKDEWYYVVGNNTSEKSDFLEIRIKRRNYNSFKETPKKDRITESAWIYKEDANRTWKYGETRAQGKDLGYKIDGYSIQDYERFR